MPVTTLDPSTIVTTAGNAPVLSNGNLTVSVNDNDQGQVLATVGKASGKWSFEASSPNGFDTLSAIA